MKTTRNVIRKMVQLALLVLCAVAMQSCDTEIPPEDLTPPKFSFRIIGDGFDHTFNQDTDFNAFRLRLKQGTTYHFNLSAGDQGGLASISWAIKTIFKLRLTSQHQVHGHLGTITMV